MTFMFSFVIAWIFGFGVYLLLKPTFLNLILGLGLLSHAVNMSLFFLGGITPGSPSIIKNQQILSQNVLDPVPQALVLTAIVIGLGMQIFLLVAVSQTSQKNKISNPEDMREK